MNKKLFLLPLLFGDKVERKPTQSIRVRLRILFLNIYSSFNRNNLKLSVCQIQQTN